MLTARPHRLAAAVAALPESKGDVRASGEALAAQRARLLTIPVEKLSSYRINPRALEILPTLAVEVRNAPLRERVIALTVSQIEQMAWPTLARLFPWVYDVEDVRRLAHARAKQAPPTLPLPRWLVMHWREAFGRKSPPQALAAAITTREPVLSRQLRYLQLSPDTPLASAVLEAVLDPADAGWLDNQPYTETLRFLEQSGVQARVRIRLMHQILSRFGGLVSSPFDIDAPIEEVFAVARKVLVDMPQNRPGLWDGVPPTALRVARWCGRLAQLRRALPPQRVEDWRQWLRRIDRVDVVGEHVAGVWVTGHVFAEPRKDAEIARVYLAHQWMAFVEAQGRAAETLPPPKPRARLSLAEGNKEINDFIENRLGQHF